MCVCVREKFRTFPSGEAEVCESCFFFHLRRLFHQTANHLNSETGKETWTYGMRPDDCNSVSQMYYLLIVVWHRSLQKRFRSWWLSVAWCSFMEQKLADAEAFGDRVLPRTGALWLASGLEVGPFSLWGTAIVTGAQLGLQFTGTHTESYALVWCSHKHPLCRLTPIKREGETSEDQTVCQETWSRIQARNTVLHLGESGWRCQSTRLLCWLVVWGHYVLINTWKSSRRFWLIRCCYCVTSWVTSWSV